MRSKDEEVKTPERGCQREREGRVIWCRWNEKEVIDAEEKKGIAREKRIENKVDI